MKTTRFFQLSISPHDNGQIAILTNFPTEKHFEEGHSFELLSKAKTSKTLRKIKRKFKSNISSEKFFCFSHMTEEQTKELEGMLI